MAKIMAECGRAAFRTQEAAWHVTHSLVSIGSDGKNKKGRGEIAPTFLIIACFASASTSVVKSIRRWRHCERQKLSSAHQQCRWKRYRRLLWPKQGVAASSILPKIGVPSSGENAH
ncbi:hypothetical protein [Shinella sp.]|uniref:hypothetical protein n=1 Tax=Shinella sp. TaxID=1870904 RepID=UPI00289BC837|nr:hypothetical protein [Shinella sp.]